MQTKKYILFGTSLMALSVSLALSSCGQSQGGQQKMGPPVVGVITVAPQSVAIDTELSGRTSAYNVADVRPQVNGVVLKRLFVEGSDVKAGQSLYQIDSATYKATLDSANANLTALRLKAERYKQLIAINAVGQQDYDDAISSYKQAEAAAESARINMRYAQVLSPISGRIGKSSVTQGALVTADQATALATVQQLDPMYVDVTRSSGELLQMKRDLASGVLKSAGPNQAKLRLTLEDGSTYPLEGKLQFSDVTVDANTGTITLRAVFPNPKHDLLPGMYVRARLVEGTNDKAILVSQASVSHDSKGNAVAMVVGADGKVQPRVLQTPRTIGNQWLVTSGLKAGDQLIVDGLQKIRPGVPVKAVPAAEKANAASTGE
jgi:membrane fusion protein (multidrug efflux system)